LTEDYIDFFDKD